MPACGLMRDMIDTEITLERFETPFLHHLGDGVIPAADIAELNATVPDRSLYRREIKSGSQHRKEYRMWRCEVAAEGTRNATADKLPAAWSKLVDSVLAADFRGWLSSNTGVDVTSSRMTVGLYVLEDGDFTTTDYGKTEKLLTSALYLNESWRPEYGGNYQLFTHKSPDLAPAKEIAPVGGRCTAMTPTETSWHRIQTVTTGGAVDRMMMMLEFWRS